ncbi:nucleotide exchange factor GrpE [Candidatus Gromoviella agglomerans]|uniref:nucleotide exchange factor GrpE n=1 Tax=Candidatus Gromoviella agglomerans TaxID=2806609 RepID=UPI001E5586C5|nr:nucleotide exchange factor GrpE [Candidatus Gromoviella agglomerans]UFX98496.1 Protein GrpE [Candidatus Gromoviella agglomerans]
MFFEQTVLFDDENHESAQQNSANDDDKKNDTSRDSMQMLSIIKEMQKQIEEKDDRIVRMASDISNITKRQSKLLEDTQNFAITRFAIDILSVADSLEKAIASISPKEKDLLNGMEAVSKEFSHVLKVHNISKIESNGAKFDPEYHEAINTVSDSEKDDNAIVDVLRNGYMIGNRCLRTSLVIVNKL